MTPPVDRSPRTPDSSARPPAGDPESEIGPGTGSSETPVENAASEDAREFRERWLRAEAELQNFRRRAQRDVEETRRFAEEQVMLDLIAGIDDLERALGSAREAGAPDSWVEGVRLVANRLTDALARRGVTAVDPIGAPFDPELHEAVLEVDAPPGLPPGHIVQVVRLGYARNGRALRPARVVVARRGPGGEE